MTNCPEDLAALRAISKLNPLVQQDERDRQEVEDMNHTTEQTEPIELALARVFEQHLERVADAIDLDHVRNADRYRAQIDAMIMTPEEINRPPSKLHPLVQQDETDRKAVEGEDHV